jgi:hypothetical protein
MSKAIYKGTCNIFKDSEALNEMLGAAKPITRKTFLKSVDTFGMKLATDDCMRYYSSRFKGKVCYFFEHSKTQHIFIKKGK